MPCSWPVPLLCSLRRDVPDKWSVGYNSVLNCHTQPFLLQFADRRVVHRSNALLDNAFGTYHVQLHPVHEISLYCSIWSLDKLRHSRGTLTVIRC